jgi:microcystin-dependent protein
MATNNSINQSEALPNPITVPKGGTGLASLTDNSILTGSGTSNITFIAPGDSGNVLTSDGTSWTSAVAGGGAPTGAIAPWVTTTAPTGWLLCDGATVSQTTYAALYSIIGHTFAADPGGGNFILPNMKGRIPVGLNSADAEFDAIGHNTGGEKTHVLTTTEMPAHTHTFQDGAGNGGGGGFYGLENPRSDADTSEVGSNTAHNNLMPYLAITFIIKT